MKCEKNHSEKLKSTSVVMRRWKIAHYVHQWRINTFPDKIVGEIAEIGHVITNPLKPLLICYLPVPGISNDLFQEKCYLTRLSLKWRVKSSWIQKYLMTF